VFGLAAAQPEPHGRCGGGEAISTAWPYCHCSGAAVITGRGPGPHPQGGVPEREGGSASRYPAQPQVAGRLLQLPQRQLVVVHRADAAV